MTFVDALLAIATRSDLTVCDDSTERDGTGPSLCVYQAGVYVGKLRWPQPSMSASVDEKIVQAIVGGPPHFACGIRRDEE